MCRLVGIVGDLKHRAALMHMLMLYGAAEREQTDGWGFTDGDLLIKLGDPFQENGSICGDLHPTKPWLGHVRSASLETELSDNAAHPYKFDCFSAAHNGSFEEEHKRYRKRKQRINTDSYRALQYLDSLVSRLPTSMPLFDRIYAKFSDWMREYGDKTTFALAFHTGRSLLFIRDERKELWTLWLGDAQIFHTSRAALLQAVWFYTNYLDNIRFSMAELLPPHTLIEVADGEAQKAATVTYEYRKRAADAETGV